MPPPTKAKRIASKRLRDGSPEGVAKASDSSSSDGSSAEDRNTESDDSSEDETENALFRPVQTIKSSDDSSDHNDDGSDVQSEDDESEAIIVPDVKESDASREGKSSAKAKASASLKASTSSILQSTNADIEDEMARKTTATVYVEGIPYKADESDIVSHFASCGSVREVRMPRYQDSGKPRGYAHIVFDAVSSVSKALKLDGKYLLGRYLTVKKAERPRTLDAAIQAQKSVGKVVKGCKTVFVKHLPYDVDESTVKDALSSCGKIVSVRLPLWNHTKKLKGFGYVEFSSEDEAATAVKRSGMKIGDRMVIISLETVGSAPKASFRLADGRYWKKGEEAKQSLATKLTEKSKAPKHSQSDKKHKRQKTG